MKASHSVLSKKMKTTAKKSGKDKNIRKEQKRDYVEGNFSVLKINCFIEY